MIVDTLKVSDLAQMAAPYNPRRMPAEKLKHLKAALQQYGCVQPVVVNRRTNRIVGGHQRVKAAEAIGMLQLPVTYVDLDERAEKSLNLALNRIQGEWDVDALQALLREVAGSGDQTFVTGFDGKDLEVLLRSFAAGTGNTDVDAIPEVPEKAQTVRGDLYLLGQHRLLCGDSLSEADVDLLCNGEPIHCVNMDPPYNVNVESAATGTKSWRGTDVGKSIRVGKRLGISLKEAKKLTPGRVGNSAPKARNLIGDFLSEEEFAGRLAAWFRNAARNLLPGRAFWIWGGFTNVFNYGPPIVAAGLRFSQHAIWVKNQPAVSRKDMMTGHEWVFYGWKPGAAHQWFGKRNVSDVWEVQKVAHTAMVHLTEKPAELAQRAIQYTTRPGENVLDLFGGSGSTLIGAESTGRVARLMEIDERYCDVIVKRWQEFTGKVAEKIPATSPGESATKNRASCGDAIHA